MNLAAGLVGLLLGALVGPLADRIATNAPHHDPLLRSVPRSSRLPLVLLGTAAFGGACGLVFGFTLEALAATLFCWVLVVITRTDFEHRLIPDRWCSLERWPCWCCARSTIRASSGYSAPSGRGWCSS